MDDLFVIVYFFNIYENGDKSSRKKLNLMIRFLGLIDTRDGQVLFYWVCSEKRDHRAL